MGGASTVCDNPVDGFVEMCNNSTHQVSKSLLHDEEPHAVLTCLACVVVYCRHISSVTVTDRSVARALLTRGMLWTLRVEIALLEEEQCCFCACVCRGRPLHAILKGPTQQQYWNRNSECSACLCTCLVGILRANEHCSPYIWWRSCFGVLLQTEHRSQRISFNDARNDEF